MLCKSFDTYRGARRGAHLGVKRGDHLGWQPECPIQDGVPGCPTPSGDRRECAAGIALWHIETPTWRGTVSRTKAFGDRHKCTVKWKKRYNVTAWHPRLWLVSVLLVRVCCYKCVNIFIYLYIYNYLRTTICTIPRRKLKVFILSRCHTCND